MTGDRDGGLTAIQAALRCMELGICPHCEVQHWPVHLTGPATGAGWAVETRHEPGCPEIGISDPARPDLGPSSEDW